MKKIILILFLSIIFSLPSFADNEEKETAKIFQQYKQDTVLPYDLDNNYPNYNMFFGSYNRGYHNRHHGRYNRYRGFNYMPVIGSAYFMPNFYMYENDNLNEDAQHYLRHLPENTLVSPDEYNIFNKSSE